jgi:diguanylate cyclase (GGDEF)-like protein/PAS domain S-box-containing protein
VALEPALRALALHALFPFACYVCAPIRIGGRLFGVIVLLDRAPRAAPFPVQAVPFLELLGENLGRAVDRNRLEALRLAAEQARDDATVLFTTAFSAAPIAMALVGIDGRLLRVNRAACRLFGQDEAALLARHFQSLTHPDDLKVQNCHLIELASGEIDDFQMEARYLRPDGGLIWRLLSVAAVRSEAGALRYFVAQIQDISNQKSLIAELSQRKLELEQANDSLTQLASRDPLTGLLNRRALRERMAQEIAAATERGTPLAFVMFDLEHFNDYNDAFGHLQGDIALREVAQSLKQSTRAVDIIGRFGGEEFLLLLPETDAVEAVQIAERTRANVAELSLLHPLTVSAGVHVFHPEVAAADGAALPSEGPAETVPLAQADIALYRAKHRGRNRVESI